MNLVELSGVAAAAFAGTNVDNLVTTTAQVAAARPGRVRRILTGQYVGFALVVVLAAVVAAALVSVPAHWIGLLGLVPISLGLRRLLALRRPEARTGQPRWPTAGGAVTSALVTAASGGDNLAVYIPLFRTTTVPEGLLVTVVFVVLDVLLVVAARTLGRRPDARDRLQRTAAVATPVLYLVIGVVVLWWSGTVAWVR